MSAAGKPPLAGGAHHDQLQRENAVACAFAKNVYLVHPHTCHTCTRTRTMTITSSTTIHRAHVQKGNGTPTVYLHTM